MNRFARFFSSSLLLLLTVCNHAEGDDARKRYIERYREIAMEQMREKGVPASITLAQGALESGNGYSSLATQGNNHFGIKCHNWSGAALYHDDDEEGECFRCYKTAEESFKDHSDYLRYSDRYASLFELDPTDYKGWAYGLKRAGYATDRDYASKLIEIIETYGLSAYDLKVVGAENEKSSSAKQKRNGALTARKSLRRLNGKESESAVEESTEEPCTPLPPSPASIERSYPAPPEHLKSYNVGDVTIDYNILEKHGICYIIANGSDTYSSIARAFHLFKHEILSFNEEKSDKTVPAGTIVYIQAKRKQSDADLARHVVERGETMKELSQRFAVKLKHLYKYNNMEPGTEPEAGSIINLRKENSKR